LPRAAEEIVKQFPSWKYDTHGWFECVWCHAVTGAKKVTYPDPQPGEAVGHIEAEDVTAHEAECPLVSMADTIRAYAAEQVAQARAEWENPTGAVMSGGVVDWKKAYQFSQAELKGARAEERKRAVGYLRVLQENHPHLRGAYRHAELNLQAVLETDWQPDATALRART